MSSLGILSADEIAKAAYGIPEKGNLMPVSQLYLHAGGCDSNKSNDIAKIGGGRYYDCKS